METSVIPIRLSGTDLQKANQLFDLLKTRELSVEQIEKLLPPTKDFLNKLNDVIDKQVDIDERCHKESISALRSITDQLGKSMNNEISDAKFHEICETLRKISQDIKEIEKNRDNNSSWFKIILSFFGFVFLAIFTVLGAKKIGNNQS